jgi:hypothetical protein
MPRHEWVNWNELGDLQINQDALVEFKPSFSDNLQHRDLGRITTSSILDHRLKPIKNLVGLSACSRESLIQWHASPSYVVEC